MGKCHVGSKADMAGKKRHKISLGLLKPTYQTAIHGSQDFLGPYFLGHCFSSFFYWPTQFQPVQNFSQHRIEPICFFSPKYFQPIQISSHDCNITSTSHVLKYNTLHPSTNSTYRVSISQIITCYSSTRGSSTAVAAAVAPIAQLPPK